ncbi:MAG TPA: metallophosphoesterase [Jatrophihabitantaceae bacterium]|nr:metallophosphoesterase [Jatrophihabitantaceae bacterium]
MDRAQWQRLISRDRLRVVGRTLRRIIAVIARWALRVTLPMAGIAIMLRSFPYRTTVQGIPLIVQGTILRSPGFSANTTLGNWEFPAVDGLPIGVHVTPQNVDVVRVAREANPDTAAFARLLQHDLAQQLPRLALWLIAEATIGFALGLAAAAAVNMAMGYLRSRPRRPDELRYRLRQLAAAVAVAALVSGYGVLSYNPRWIDRSRLTGTLAAAQLLPDQLSSYYQRGNKLFDVLGSIVGLQSALQADIDAQRTPDTALQIMFISDMHLETNYPLVEQYAKSYGVNLIVNTGDESEFGTRTELVPAYLNSIAALTKTVPMLWLAGNHDSPEVEGAMRSIPGVTVLGSKSVSADGYTVSASQVEAFGLTIAGLPDPRVYGAAGAFGSNDPPVTDPLERKAVDAAVAGTPARAYDIFATHEPAAAAELRKAVPGAIRQTNAGHLHAQNAASSIQHGSSIDLVEGSIGAGGLDNIVRGVARPPIEFSIESVTATCQFSRILRFQVNEPDAASVQPQPYGQDVTVSTIYLRPQDIPSTRVCDPQLGLGEPIPLR